jgi:hypothetical protein
MLARLTRVQLSRRAPLLLHGKLSISHTTPTILTTRTLVPQRALYRFGIFVYKTGVFVSGVLYISAIPKINAIQAESGKDAISYFDATVQTIVVAAFWPAFVSMFGYAWFTIMKPWAESPYFGYAWFTIMKPWPESRTRSSPQDC